MNEILFNVLKVVIIIVCGLITAYLIPWIKEKVAGTKFELLLKWIAKAVKAAEQTMLGDKVGFERKTWVVDFLKKLLIKKHIAITDEQLDALVEAAVYEMNNSGILQSEDEITEVKK